MRAIRPPCTHFMEAEWVQRPSDLVKRADIPVSAGNRTAVVQSSYDCAILLHVLEDVIIKLILQAIVTLYSLMA
jgi:hypothetical protein